MAMSNKTKAIAGIISAILLYSFYNSDKFTEWYYIPNPLYIITPVWILIFLFYIGFPFSYLKWHLSIVLAPFKVIPFVKKALTLTKEDKQELRRYMLFKIKKNGKLKAADLHDYLAAVSLAFFLYLQLFVWLRVLLYKLFGIKIPFAFVDPQYAPWR